MNWQDSDFASFDDVFSPTIDTNNCVPAFKVDVMNPAFWRKVQKLAYMVDSIKVNSAFRTPAWEYSRHRSGNSQHCKGLAVDISCLTNEYRYRLVDAAIKLDFHRILIYPRFVHLDDKEQGSKREIIWMNNQ